MQIWLNHFKTSNKIFAESSQLAAMSLLFVEATVEGTPDDNTKELRDKSLFSTHRMLNDNDDDNDRRPETFS
jgi:hypothetical protein